MVSGPVTSQTTEIILSPAAHVGDGTRRISGPGAGGTGLLGTPTTQISNDNTHKVFFNFSAWCQSRGDRRAGSHRRLEIAQKMANHESSRTTILAN
jgi:hypothetical protein